MQAKSGLMSITGPDQTMDDDTVKTNPYKVGTAIIDVMTGMYAVTAILSALIKLQNMLPHEQTSEYIDLSLYDVSLSLLANQSMNYLVSGNSPKRLGNR
jgi:crotonobetainyl-CoA:carnitine CoA-transferase CaiB-like acyl-CoA transferase